MPDCHLGLLPPGPVGEPEAGTVLVVAPSTPLFRSRLAVWSTSHSPATQSESRVNWCRR